MPHGGAGSFLEFLIPRSWAIRLLAWNGLGAALLEQHWQWFDMCYVQGVRTRKASVLLVYLYLGDQENSVSRLTAPIAHITTLAVIHLLTKSPVPPSRAHLPEALPASESNFFFHLCHSAQLSSSSSLLKPRPPKGSKNGTPPI